MNGTPAKKAGKIGLDLEQNLTDKIVSNHRVGIDMRDNFQTVAMAYGSGNAPLESMPEEALSAKLNLGAFSDTFDIGQETGVFITIKEDRHGSKETGREPDADSTGGSP